MNNKELRHLSRKDLLELLIDQTQKNDELKSQVRQLESRLKEKQLLISETGTLAEAALKLSNVYSDADKAAEMYLANIRINEAESMRKIEEAKKRAEEIIHEAEQTGLKKIEDANRYIIKAKNAVKRYLAEHPEIKININE